MPFLYLYILKDMRVIFLLSCCLNLCQAAVQNESSFQIMFWNVENLFDAKNDSLKNDEDFLPNSLKHWSDYRYYQKLQQLSKAIIASGEWNPPALIGLCEVENDSVLYDLTHRTGLKNLDYRYVVTQSKDLRGIDVALLYQPDLFRLIASESIDVGRLPVGKRTTRDLLHVIGQVVSGDTLDLFIAHLPSRFGGAKHSEPNRIHVSRVLKEKIDSVMCRRVSPKLVIMGDFNDYPQNKSISKILSVQNPSNKVVDIRGLYHMLAYSNYKKQRRGTYKYKNSWDILDHMILSGAFLDEKSSCRVSSKEAQIINHPFLLTKDEKYGGLKPFRTYNGMHYLGGFSDHLPIILELKIAY